MLATTERYPTARRPGAPSTDRGPSDRSWPRPARLARQRMLVRISTASRYDQSSGRARARQRYRPHAPRRLIAHTTLSYCSSGELAQTGGLSERHQDSSDGNYRRRSAPPRRGNSQTASVSNASASASQPDCRKVPAGCRFVAGTSGCRVHRRAAGCIPPRRGHVRHPRVHDVAGGRSTTVCAPGSSIEP
jgi:hypothetical protein